MPGGWKTLIAALAALLLACGLAACGGGDSGTTASSGQPSGEAGSASVKKAEGAAGSGSAAGGAKSSAGGNTSSRSASAGGGSEATSGSEHFVPRHHHDSGGGSGQFRVKGGDNSIQEFGSEVDGSEFERAAVVLHDFLDARAEGDWAAACSYMSKGIVESFKQFASQAKQPSGTSCASLLEALTNPAAKQAMKAEAAQADVGSLRTEGERAFLIYRGAGSTVFAMPMVSEGGGWKVGSLAGTPLS